MVLTFFRSLFGGYVFELCLLVMMALKVPFLEKFAAFLQIPTIALSLGIPAGSSPGVIRQLYVWMFLVQGFLMGILLSLVVFTYRSLVTPSTRP
jgi:hypothetical protein